MSPFGPTGRKRFGAGAIPGFSPWAIFDASLRDGEQWERGTGAIVTKLEVEELAEALGLGAADGDFSLLLVVHAELVAGLEPGHDFADLVDVDDEASVGAPEASRVEQLEQLLKGAALGLALEDSRDDANDSFID